MVGKDLLDRATPVAGKIRLDQEDLAQKEAEHNRGAPAAAREAIDKLHAFFDHLGRSGDLDELMRSVC